MAASGTPFTSLITQVRNKLVAPASSDIFWTDDEIATDLGNGCKDLWKAINDLHQHHFFTNDTTHVTYDSGTTSLTGVPDDVYRVFLIEPRDTTINASTRNILFIPRKYNDEAFQYGRSLSGQDPTQAQIYYYEPVGQGSPIGVTQVLVAPPTSSQIPLRFVYFPTLPVLDKNASNPIPGESDNALLAWGIAYSRAKEREDRSPDPNWLAIYATEKQNILTSLTPRQEQEPDVVPGFFEFYQNF